MHMEPGTRDGGGHGCHREPHRSRTADVLEGEKDSPNGAFLLAGYCAGDVAGERGFMHRALETAVREPEPDFAAVNVLFHPDHELVRLVSFRRGASLRGATGLAVAHPRLTANANTPWAKLKWLDTVLVFNPADDFAAMYAAMCSVVIVSMSADPK
jgi:hypothetical protein